MWTFLICKYFTRDTYKLLLVWVSEVTDVCIQVGCVVRLQMPFTSHTVGYLACNHWFLDTIVAPNIFLHFLYTTASH